MKNLISTSLHTMELIARNKAFDAQADFDKAEIKSLKADVKSLDKENKLLTSSKRVLVAERDVLQEEKNSLEEKLKSTSTENTTNKTRAERLDKLLIQKDEDLLAKIGSLAKAETDLVASRAEQSRLNEELAKSRAEHAALKQENDGLKVQLMGKARALEEMESALHAAEKDKEEGIAAQVEDCINQMRDVYNEYFLKGWEAAMKVNNVEHTQPIYTDVPFPDPNRPIPPFSYQLPPSTPTIQTLEEELGEDEAEVQSAAKDESSSQVQKIDLVVEGEKDDDSLMDGFLDFLVETALKEAAEEYMDALAYEIASNPNNKC